MSETRLHRELINLYTLEGDQQEALLAGYLVDILHNERVIEIQTRNFFALRPKLAVLLEEHPVLLVHPIMQEKWIVRQDGDRLDCRKSPRHGRAEDIFYELIRFPGWIEHPNLTLEVLLISAEEMRRNDGLGSWRRHGWSIIDRRLLAVHERLTFQRGADLLCFLPENLERPFSVKMLAHQAHMPERLAAKMIYCLRQMGQLEQVGKLGRAHLFDLAVKD